MSLDEATQKPHDRLNSYLAADMDRVNTLIRERMVSEHAPRIPQVTAHLVEAGGKRLRPMLTLAAARMCGYDGPFHIHLAATVEFIHTATLLHDDVVDESSQRRGRPTANLLWDNKSSVLVGDYLFARAFQLMVEPGNLRVLDILANASATIPVTNNPIPLREPELPVSMGLLTWRACSPGTAPRSRCASAR